MVNSTPPPGLLSISTDFLRWEPVAPRDAEATGRHKELLACAGLLREEVTERVGDRAARHLTAPGHRLAQDALPGRERPEEFADGYAQAVTFGMLIAQGTGDQLSSGLETGRSATRIGTMSLIGTALGRLT